MGQRARDRAVGPGGRGLGDAVGPRRPSRAPMRLTDRTSLPLVSRVPFPPHPQLHPRCGHLACPQLAPSLPSGFQSTQFGRGPGEPCLPARAARAATSAASHPLGTAGRTGAAQPLVPLSRRIGVRLGPAMTCMCLSPDSYRLSQVFQLQYAFLSSLPSALVFPSPPPLLFSWEGRPAGSAQPSAPKRKLGLGVITVHRVVETDRCSSPRKSAANSFSLPPGKGAWTSKLWNLASGPSLALAPSAALGVGR